MRSATEPGESEEGLGFEPFQDGYSDVDSLAGSFNPNAYVDWGVHASDDTLSPPEQGGDICVCCYLIMICVLLCSTLMYITNLH